MKKKTGIIVASFGTTHADTTEKTIGAVENAVRENCPGIPVERAYTSGMIRRILEKRGISIHDMEGAFGALRKEQVTDVIVLSTQLIAGEEYDKVCAAAEAEKGFDSIFVTKPLLSDENDFAQVLGIIDSWVGRRPEEAVILAGHGTEHPANAVYGALDRYAKENGFADYYVGTIEAQPDLKSALRAVKEKGYENVLITPLLLVAGDHAKNDIAVEWVKAFEENGFHVRVRLAGLGEYEGVRRLYAGRLEGKL